MNDSNSYYCNALIVSANWEHIGNGIFFPRSFHTSVVYDSKLWIFGGYAPLKYSVAANDVWFSSDGGASFIWHFESY